MPARSNARRATAQRKPAADLARLAVLRSVDLTKIFRDRYGHTLPDDDAGRDDALLMLGILAWRPNAGKLMRNFLEVSAPWLRRAEAEAMIADALSHPPMFASADVIAHRLGLSFADRQRLGVTTIGAIDCDKAAREERRRRRKNDRRRECRRRDKAKANEAATAAKADTTRRQAAWRARCWAELDKAPGDRCAQVMRAWSVEGALAPGPRFTDRQVADLIRDEPEFIGLSPATLRKVVQRAINDLAGLGLFEILPATGPFQPRQTRKLGVAHTGTKRVAPSRPGDKPDARAEPPRPQSVPSGTSFVAPTKVPYVGPRCRTSPKQARHAGPAI
jgi:hypothetical protein